MQKIIPKNKSLIPACDVSLEIYEQIIKETALIEGVGGYKVGFLLGLHYGLPKVMEITRKYTNKPIIYDHQKAGTDIPDTGPPFSKLCKKAGIDAVILFPQSGPATEKAWIESALEQGLGVIVGGLMTHPRYIRSEGGYLADEAIIEMYLNASRLGVTDFVVPGNRPDDARKIRDVLVKEGILPTFYFPGLTAQGGELSKVAGKMGDNWHAIVGRGIYEADDKKQAVLGLVNKLL